MEKTARISLDRLSSPLAELLDYKGEMYSDGWISPEFSFRFRALEDVDAVELRLWNPDFASRYLHNRLTITIDDVTRTSPLLYPAQLVKFDHVVELRAGRSSEVKIVSERFCEPDALDERARGVIFVESRFTPGKPRAKTSGKSSAVSSRREAMADSDE
ncbi:MAG: hypothetical protein H7X93_05855 [Sphingomonadaceae bacterium]|nr:hypothetical protein [Sphingomonadaceae bacterium]